MYHIPFNAYNILKHRHDFWDTLYYLVRGTYVYIGRRVMNNLC
jgi:hypothetical protein